MIDITSSIEEVKAHIHKMFAAKTKSEKAESEAVIFIPAQSFLDYGVFPLEMCFEFHKAGFIDIAHVEIEPYATGFDVVRLSAAFRKACEGYVRPPEVPRRGEMFDFYSDPNEFLSETDFDQNDYRGGSVFLMSEAKLREELKNRDRKWLIYRTPYRPETETELRRPL